jgi:hypothetical protein
VMTLLPVAGAFLGEVPTSTFKARNLCFPNKDSMLVLDIVGTAV